MNPKSTIVVFLCACTLACVWFLSHFLRTSEQLEHNRIGAEQVRELEKHRQEMALPRKRKSHASDAEVATIVSEKARNKISAALVERLLRAMRANRRAAIDGEAILSFEDGKAFDHFVEISKARRSPVSLLGVLESLKAVRIGYNDLEDLRDLLNELDGIELDIDANYIVRIPIYPVPDPDDPLPGSSGGAPFRNTSLRFLGVRNGQNAGWGKGVVIAVIDSGVADHTTFRDGQVRAIGTSIIPAESEPGDNALVDGHGTAVASIIAGNDARTPGVAPQAQILSLQLLDSEGNGDSFTLAQLIGEAVAAGAQIINLSVGSYGDSQLVREMVAEASSNQRLLVASTGNDGADTIVYPAAYDEVIAVGAIDAQGEHLEFSNSGEQLDLAAPGLAIDAAWPNGQMVAFSGTSASTPFVTGAIAAVMSENPALSPQQAWQLIQQFTDEAGAPGPDPMVGRGNLNIGRLMERDERGIYDLALTSHYLDPDSTSQNIQVTVQNRGTEVLANIGLNVTSPNREQRFNIAQLRPGQIATREVNFDHQLAASTGSITIGSFATLPQTTPDRTPANNLLQSLITFGTEEKTAAK
ncbi:MAG: subtilisin family serine protease [Verrucomicrobiales bacterium]|jgi:subtilisin family serine protease